MIVCHCRGISDRAIRKAVRDGARSRHQVVQACAAGKTCGGCGPAIDEILETESDADRVSAFTGLGELVVAG